MKKVNLLILSLILCFSCIVIGCNKTANVSETTEDSALLEVTPNPSQLVIQTSSTFETVFSEPTDSSESADIETTTTETDCVDDTLCGEGGKGLDYLDNDPGTPPTQNLLSQQDLTNQTYATDGGYVTYPLAHTGYSKIGFYTWDQFEESTLVYVSIQTVTVDAQGRILINGTVFYDDDTTDPITLCLAGVRGFESSALTDPLNDYLINTLKFSLFGFEGGEGSCYFELGETIDDITYGYGWNGSASGDNLYQVQEYLLAYGYVEPYATNNTIKYWDYYTQYPELFKSW